MPRLVVPILFLPLRISRCSSSSPVVRQHHVGGFADQQMAVHLDLEFFQPLDFLDQAERDPRPRRCR